MERISIHRIKHVCLGARRGGGRTVWEKIYSIVLKKIIIQLYNERRSVGISFEGWTK